MNIRMISNLTIATAILLSGCHARTDDRGDAYDPVLYRDRVTGCEYLSTGNTASLTPRMGADGKQVCRAVRP